MDLKLLKSVLLSEDTLLSDDVKVKILHPLFILFMGTIVWYIKEAPFFWIYFAGLLVPVFFWSKWISQFYHRLDYDDYDVLPSLVIEPTEKQKFYKTKIQEKKIVEKGVLKIILGDMVNEVDSSDNVGIAWFNTLLLRFWVNLKAAVEDYVLHVIWPSVRYVIKHSSTVFDLELYSLGLGSVAPKIESIDIQDSEQDEDNLIIDIKITWASEVTAGCRLLTGVTPVYMKLDSLLVSLKIRLTLIGLMEQPPFAKSIGFCLLEEPILNWRLGGVGKITNSSTLHNIIKGIVYKEIRQFIFPSQLTIPIKTLPLPDHLLDTMDSQTFRETVIPQPQGILSVAVKSCRNLPAGDWSSSLLYPKSFFRSPEAWLKSLIPRRVSTDAFVEVKVGAASIRSEIKYGSLHPEFDFSSDIPIECPLGSNLHIRIYDYDVVTANDLLGFREENLSILVNDKESSNSDKVSRVEDGLSWRGLLGGSRGECLMNYTWNPVRLLTDKDDLDNITKGVLAFSIQGITAPMACLPDIKIRLLQGDNRQTEDGEFRITTTDEWRSAKAYKTSEEYQFGPITDAKMDLFLLVGGMLTFNKQHQTLEIELTDKISKREKLDFCQWTCKLPLTDLIQKVRSGESTRFTLNRTLISAGVGTPRKTFEKMKKAASRSKITEDDILKTAEIDLMFRVYIVN